MTKIDKSEQIDHHRRRFFGAAAVSAAAVQLGLTRSAPAQTKLSTVPAIKPGTNTSFGLLKIEQRVLVGFDWGARTANIIAALWPERCKALVSVSGYLIGSQTERPLTYH